MTKQWHCNDNVVTMQRQRHDNAMTMRWQRDDNGMATQWQWNDIALTMQGQCNDNAMAFGTNPAIAAFAYSQKRIATNLKTTWKLMNFWFHKSLPGLASHPGHCRRCQSAAGGISPSPRAWPQLGLVTILLPETYQWCLNNGANNEK